MAESIIKKISGTQHVTLSALNEITGSLHLYKDYGTGTIRGYGFFRRSTNISSDTSIFQIPTGYRPKENYSIPMFLATSANANGCGFYGWAYTDGSVKQSLGNTIREGFTVFEYEF